MPTSKKQAEPQAEAPDPNASTVTRYHVYKVERDMGEVTMMSPAENLEDVISTVSPTPELGLFVVFTEGEKDPVVVSMLEEPSIKIKKVKPKDLFQ
jgi:hypothetical protein